MIIYADSTDVVSRRLRAEAVFRSERVENFKGNVHDLGANAVARQGGKANGFH